MRPRKIVLYSMRDLLTNVKKAIEILNKSKNLTISLTDPSTIISDVPPVGVSMSEWKESILEIVKDLLFTADNLYINFDCSFDYEDLRAIEGPSTRYQEAMQRIIKEIYERYKWAKSIDEVSGTINGQPQTITGLKTYGGWNLGSATMQSGFSNLQVAGDLNVNGEIEADDIKVNGGQLSVSSELDALKQKNQALEAELDVLKAILTSKGVL